MTSSVRLRETGRVRLRSGEEGGTLPDEKMSEKSEEGGKDRSEGAQE